MKQPTAVVRRRRTGWNTGLDCPAMVAARHGGYPPLATGVRQVRRDQKELDLTESDTGRSSFLLSPSCMCR